MSILKRFIISLLLCVICPSAMAMVEQCVYFKSAVQTWDDSKASLEITAPSYVKNANGSDRVGFYNYQIEGNHNSACQISDSGATRCKGSESLIVEKPDFSQTQFLGEKGNVSVMASGTITPGSYKSLTITTGQGGVIQVEPGEYWIDDFLLSGEEQLFFSSTERTVIHVGRLSRSGRSSFNHKGKPDNLIIKAYNAVFGHAQISMNGVGSFNGLIISEHEFVANSDIEVIGAVTAPQITLSNGARVIAEGDCFVERPKLELRISPTTDSGAACDGIPITFSLVNSKTNQVVVGGGQSLAVTSSPQSGSNTACWSDNGSITTNQCTPNANHGFRATFVRGQAASITRYIHSKFLNDYNISANVASEGLTEKAGPYRFAPSALLFFPDGIDGADDRQVARRPFAARFKLSGSKGNGNQLNCSIIDHDGFKTIQLSNTQLPTDSPHSLNVSINGGQTWQSANTNLSLQFKDGVAGGDVNAADGSILFRLDDAGLVDIKAATFSFGKYLEVKQSLYFRPFSLSLCDKNGALPHYTDEPNGGFVASGSDVTSYLKALGWIKARDKNNDGIPDFGVTAATLCGEDTVPSYYTHNGFPAKVSFEQPSVVYPALGANNGKLTLDGTELSGDSVEVTSSKRNQPLSLSWSEVGTVAVSASQANYMGLSGFNIPGVMAKIGRFYPAHLKMMPVAEQWKYVDGHDGFAYMGQPISHSFKVEAQNVAGEPTSNYGLFSDELIADLQYVAQSQPSGDSLFDRVLVAGKPNFGSWKEHEFRNDDTSALELSFNDFSFVKNSVKATPLTTQPDGPFNAANAVFGLRITDDPDGIRFSNGDLDAAFPSQPEFRYGRMRLQDVGSVTEASDLNVPLKVEYWRHHRFVTNTDDNSSNFDANDYCRQVSWSESGTTTSVQLKGKGAVSSGVSSKLLINQNSTNREQVRVWARIDSAPPVKSADENSIECFTDAAMPHRPWLRYNWRDIGDEDPSSVITFGIYRGNDRIIFRGEPGLFAH